MDKKYSVLFVDDEINILNSLRRGLLDEDYNCYFASSGAEALQILEKNKISVVVTDMRMPGMDGLTLLREIKMNYPSIVRIVLSGYTQLQQILATINQVDIFKFITKPWKMEEEFKGVIRQALDYFKLREEREELEKALQNKNTAYQKILKNIGEIIDSAKKSTEGVKQLGSSTFEYFAKMVATENDKEITKNKILQAMNIFNELSEVYAEEPKSVNLSALFLEISEHIKLFSDISEFDIKVNIPSDINVKAKVNLISRLYKNMMGIFTNENKKSCIRIMFKGEFLGEDSYRLNCSVQVSCFNDSTSSEEDWKKTIDSDIELINTMLGTLMVFLGGSFTCGRSENAFLSKITFKFKLVSDTRR